MKIIWNKTFIIVYLMTFLSPSWLFSQGEPSVGEWKIKDYKNAIMSEDYEILEFKQFAAFETGEKYFFCKERENLTSSREISFSLYVFNKNKEFYDNIIGFPMDEPVLEAISQGIPGIRLWDAPVFIGDFNNDGRNEIASLIDTASAARFQILSIELDRKNLVCYFDQEVAFGGRLKTTLTPVEFVRYKNMKGFKMLRMVPPSERPNVKYPYDDYEGYNGSKGLAWFFYKWDEREKEYVIVEEIDPTYLSELLTDIDVFCLEDKNDMSENEEELSSFQSEVNDKKSKFYIYVSIIVSIILLVALTVIIMVKRKKK